MDEFAYPTNLESAPLYLENDDDADDGYSFEPISEILAKASLAAEQEDDMIMAKSAEIVEKGHSRSANTSNDSDLILVTVEDLLISEEKARTVKANMDQLRSSRMPLQDILEPPVTLPTKSKGYPSNSAHDSKRPPSSSSSSSSLPPHAVPATAAVVKESASPVLGTKPRIMTTKTITATIRSQEPETPGEKKRTTLIFDDDESSRLQLFASSINDSYTEPMGALQHQSTETECGNQKSSPSSSKSSQQSGCVSKTTPPKLLTLAQQREAEIDDLIQKAIELHEGNQLDEATRHFYMAAQSENPLGQLMYGLSLRHGWGCKPNPREAIIYLQRAAEFAMGELKELGPPSRQSAAATEQLGKSHHSQLVSCPLPSTSEKQGQDGKDIQETTTINNGAQLARTPSKSVTNRQGLRRMGSLDRGAAIVMARKELVMALYELGMSYLKGWGVSKDKPVAFAYFKVAADLGDPDSQQEAAHCYSEGIGVGKDNFESARYYRMAAAQGAIQMGNSWIWKPKYDQYCATEATARAQGTNTGNGSTSHPPPANGSKFSRKTRSRASSAASATAAFVSLPLSSVNSGAHYSISGITAGVATVTATTAGTVLPGTMSSGSCNNHGNEMLTDSTLIAPGPRKPPPLSPSAIVVASGPMTNATSSTSSSVASTPTSPAPSSGKKHRWSFWGHSNSSSNVVNHSSSGSGGTLRSLVNGSSTNVSTTAVSQ
ncbi:hypothetical protein BGW38_003555 [Lunasporangiospora selenospora]|uniref:Sel1 repeat-containing protein n=1 Tax=Lunasporangiospora selenospora TaxID=979761 RepID=A0A9P6FR11_9FUNG|nr:hypothetical protein BGW38_003555 [Lunasporangiospora selenospora]